MLEEYAQGILAKILKFLARKLGALGMRVGMRVAKNVKTEVFDTGKQSLKKFLRDGKVKPDLTATINDKTELKTICKELEKQGLNFSIAPTHPGYSIVYDAKDSKLVDLALSNSIKKSVKKMPLDKKMRVMSKVKQKMQNKQLQVNPAKHKGVSR